MAVPTGILVNSEINANTIAMVRAHGSLCSNPQPARNPNAAFAKMRIPRVLNNAVRKPAGTSEGTSFISCKCGNRTFPRISRTSPPRVLNAENASHKIASRCTWRCTRPGRGCGGMLPRICLPQPLQNACPDCIAVPHPSQNMIFPSRTFVSLTLQNQNSTDDTRPRLRSSVPTRANHNILHCIRSQSKTKRPPGNWVASSSRENSSNGGFRFRQNFLPKSYEPKNGGVKGFLRNKRFCFQYFTKCVNIRS